MRRELKVSLTKQEVGDLLVKAVTRKLNLPEGEYKCTACSMDGEALVIVFDVPEKAP